MSVFGQCRANSAEKICHLLLDASPAPLIICRGVRVIYANASAIDLFGANTLQSLLGQTIKELIPEEGDLLLPTATSGNLVHQSTRAVIRQNESCVDVIITTIPFRYNEMDQIALYFVKAGAAKQNRMLLLRQEEHRRLADALHDNLGQSLILAKMELDQIALHCNCCPGDLLKISDKLKRVCENIESLTCELNEPTLFLSGVEQTLLEWFRKNLQSTGLTLRSDISPDVNNIPHDLLSFIYRALRELLMNVVKHSCATQANVQVLMDANDVLAEVQDNGKGFIDSVYSPEHFGHYGLKSIQERVNYLGGSFSITCRAGYTKVHFSIPL